MTYRRRNFVAKHSRHKSGAGPHKNAKQYDRKKGKPAALKQMAGTKLTKEQVDE